MVMIMIMRRKKKKRLAAEIIKYKSGTKKAAAPIISRILLRKILVKQGTKIKTI
jgi:hypothetical protein